MAKIEMLDDHGNVTEVIEVRPHRCSPESCESDAICEDCGATGSKTVVYIFTTSTDMTYFMCGPCIDRDDYVRREVGVADSAGNEVYRGVIVRTYSEPLWDSPDVPRIFHDLRVDERYGLETLMTRIPDGILVVEEPNEDPAGDSQAGANAADGVA